MADVFISAIRVVPQSVYDLCLFNFRKEIKVFFNISFLITGGNIIYDFKRFGNTCKRIVRTRR